MSRTHNKPQLLVSFSGGKTSGKMAHDLKNNYSHKYEMAFVFANTGQEREETLWFVDRCDREWELGVVWVEAVVHHGEERGCTHKVVTYETASRDGEPFEEVIKKYGIPNVEWLHCTRELKTNPIRSYARDVLGWTEYLTAIGIRADEPDRLTTDPKKVYPLAVYPHLFYEADFAEMYSTKPMINDWWEDQPFNLPLKDYEGNCKTCFKKNTPKLVRIAQEHPEYYEWSARIEERYGYAGYNEGGNYKRVFYRNNMDTKAILELANMSTLPPLPPDYADTNGGCSESCEAF